MAKTEWSQADGRVVSVDSMSTRGRRQLTITFTYFVGNQSYKGSSIRLIPCRRAIRSSCHMTCQIPVTTDLKPGRQGSTGLRLLLLFLS
jgi:hypothetical protein